MSRDLGEIVITHHFEQAWVSGWSGGPPISLLTGLAISTRGRTSILQRSLHAVGDSLSLEGILPARWRRNPPKSSEGVASGAAHFCDSPSRSYSMISYTRATSSIKSISRFQIGSPRSAPRR